ncbi:Tetracycline resistance protein, class C [Alphaproteobacteria bacterium SO-S41]|nr:Tetracycline resistance protein, class C [Alphaproteobacteria bacterium SO-S41]
METPPLLPPRRQAALVFVFITVVLDVLAMGIIIPVLPHLVLGFEGGDNASAAAIYGYFGLTFAIAQFFFSPIIGSLSDRFGRRPVLLISIFGHGLDFMLMALAPTLAWLFVGRVLSGVTGASFSTANAYIADVTPPEKRAQSFGMVGAAFGLGFVIGPALGGLAGEVDPRLPFWIAAGLCLLNTAYGWFALPESLPPERRSAFSWRKANPIGSLGFLREHGEVFWLTAVSVIWNTAFWVIPSTSVLYAGYRYGWTERDVGLMMAAIGVGNIIVQMVLMRPAIRLLGEALALRTGLGFAIAGMLIYAFAPVGWIFLIGIGFQAMAGLMGPSLQALMTRRVKPDEQGKLQGALASAIGISGMIGPLLFSQVFAWAIGAGAGYGVPGAAFMVAAALNVVALTVAWITTQRDVGAS